MKNNNNISLSTLAVTLIISGSITPGEVHAAIIIIIQDDGSNLKMTATGNYDDSLMSPAIGLPLGANAAIAPDFGNGVYGWEHGASDS